MSKLHVWLNSSLILADNAQLNITDLAIQRGYGIFDYLKTINGKPVFLEDHLNRFFNSAKFMRLDIKTSRNEVRDRILELISTNNLSDSGMKIILTGGFSPDGFSIAEPNLIISQQSFNISKTFQEEGISLITDEYQRQFSSAKTLDYLHAIWLQPDIKEKHADDVLYHSNGFIRECPRANIFIVSKDNHVLTPEFGMLKGVARKHVLEISESVFQTEARDVSLDELKNAKEVFITSTTKNILPVVQIDGQLVADGKPGEITRTLAKKFLEKIANS
jgi:branched-chain amino acid aminotransferase